MKRANLHDSGTCLQSIWQSIGAATCVDSMAEIHGIRQRAEFAIFLALAASTLWLFNRPYTGIWHDAIIYSLLAARWLNPSNYSNELFFLFGSQDDLNLFTPAWAWLISWVGLDSASRVVVLLGGGMWCFSFAVLGRAFFGYALPTVFVTLMAAILSISYSPNGDTFILNETFATARVLSMPLALLGVSADLAERRKLGVFLCLVSTAFHPLLGIWGLLLVTCRKWSRALTVIAAVAVFVFVFLIGPLLLTKLLQPMSPDWMTAVRHSSMDVFVDPKIALSFGKPLFWIASLWLGALLGQPRFRGLFFATLALAAAAYLLAYICSNYYPAKLIIQAQPWRVLWLATCIGLFALVDVVWRSVKKGETERLLMGLILLVAYTLVDYAAIVVASISCLSAFCSHESRVRWLNVLAVHRGKIRMALCLAFLIVLPSLLVDIEMAWAGIIDHRGLPDSNLLWGFLIAGGSGLGLVFWGVVSSFSTLRRIYTLLFVPAIAFAWSGWDQRPEKSVELDKVFLSRDAATYFPQNPIATGDVVAWPGHEMRVWFVIGAANYATATQAIGIVFSEDKAREADRRIKRLAAASMMDEASIGNDPRLALLEYQRRMQTKGIDVLNIHKYAPDVIRANGVRYLCSDKALDWVVSDQTRDPSFGGLPVVKEIVVRGTSYGVIRCADLRERQ